MLPLLVSLCLSAPFNDAKHGFAFDLPAGFQRAEETTPPTLHTFARGEDVLQLVSLGGTISQRPINHATAEAAARKSAVGVDQLAFEYREVPWGAFTLEVMVLVGRRADGAGSVVSYATQLPLKPQAVQVMLVGDQARDAALFGEFRALVGSFKGPSSWPQEDAATVEDSRKLGERIGFMVGLACLPVSAAVLALVIWLVRRKRAPTKP